MNFIHNLKQYGFDSVLPGTSQEKTKHRAKQFQPTTFAPSILRYFVRVVAARRGILEKA
jgi:hypothetical protein